MWGTARESGDTGAEAVARHQLDLLLGETRATILRGLEQPRTMGELAGDTGLAANALSYHCGHLETMGLVTRRRHGRSIRIARTERARALVEVFGV